jgi:cell division protease FtsH
MANEKSDNPQGPQVAPPRPQLPRWAWLVFLAAALALNLFFYSPRAQPRAEISYTNFMTQLRAGNVATVELSGESVSGDFRSPVNLPPSPGSTAASQPFSQFLTTRPPVEDPRLLPLLEEQRVVVSAVVPTTPWFVGLIGNALPFLLLIGLLVLATRQMGRAQGGMFGIGQSKARVYTAERPAATFADVAGQDQAKAELVEVVDFLKSPDRYVRLGARIPRGVLLSGPPGTGKTLLARAVAGEAEVPFFSVNGSEFVEMIVGVGASRVRDLFAKAKAAAPCLIFIDEIDAIGRTRGGNMLGGNDEREQTLNQLLVEMDGFDRTQAIIVLAATNRPDVLDQALLRAGRFDRQVVVDPPDRIGREGILQIHTRDIPLGPDVDLDRLARATPGFSGADLANLANEAALAATRRGAETVERVDFEMALDRIILGAERRGIVDPSERRVVAYHEAGHALTALMTPGADPVNKVTIIPRGRSLGVTEQLPEGDRSNYSRTYLLGRLVVLFGGRAAEESVIGDITTGAESDIHEAVRLVRAMVGRWGMSERVGFIACRQGQPRGYAGLENGERCEISESAAAVMDAEVQAILTDRHAEALRIVRDYRPTLDALAEALLKEETLDASRIAEIMESAKVPVPVLDGKQEPSSAERLV